MQLLPILIAIILGVLALAFVLQPLYQNRSAKTTKDASTPDRLNGHSNLTTNPALPEHEQAARTALHEIELDYQLGNISETDYRTLRERYMRRAIVAMKSRYDHDQELDEQIEEQLRKLRENENNEQR